MRRRLCLATLIAFLAVPFLGFAVRAADTSTGGISLSMAPEDIRQKFGDAYTLSQTANIARGKVFNFIKDGEAFNFMTLGPKVVFIEHEQIFEPGQELAASDLKKALEAKYGKPSIAGGSATDASETWVLDKEGAALTGAANRDMIDACAQYETEGPVLKVAGKQTFEFGYPKIPAKDTMAKCGVVIQSRPNYANQNPGLVTYLNVVVFDVAEANSWFAQAMSEYNKHLDEQVDEARKNKPKL